MRYYLISLDILFKSFNIVQNFYFNNLQIYVFLTLCPVGAKMLKWYSYFKLLLSYSNHLMNVVLNCPQKSLNLFWIFETLNMRFCMNGPRGMIMMTVKVLTILQWGLVITPLITRLICL